MLGYTVVTFMNNNFWEKIKPVLKHTHFWIIAGFLFYSTLIFFIFPSFFASEKSYVKGETAEKTENPIEKIKKPVEIEKLDMKLYDAKLVELANNPPPKPPTVKITKDPKTGAEIKTVTEPKPVLNIWPPKTVYPNGGAILPFKRIIAYYGNLYSRKMGVLGEYDESEMLAKLEVEVKKWETADPETPVVPALHYIAVVAQGSAGADGKYRFRMPDKEIDKVMAMAEKINGIVFLDIQVGFSDLQTEVPKFEKYLKL